MKRQETDGGLLICGSFAYDHIMVFRDRFTSHILPEQLRILHVSFQVSGLRREFGGCAGNIAYSLNLLRPGSARPVGAVGGDFSDYAARLRTAGIDTRLVREFPKELTSQAFIITDLDDNQITAFHAGAMNRSHELSLAPGTKARLAILSPDGRDGMLRRAVELSQAGIPFLFDPGQGLPLFDGPQLHHFLEEADWMACNDYEWRLFQKRSKLNLPKVLERIQALIVTHGARGSVIYTREKEYRIPPAPASRVEDPTGCGDAYRAGLLYGMLEDWDWEQCGRLAALLGTLKVEHPGTQNHRFDWRELGRRYQAAYGEAPPWPSPGTD